ncbi:MAG: hypothetical protein IPP57_26805 [Candidatus Obscuribacter sp.]|jgi:hypothetical protein|nr:hypothetical protein [Candidatus Obscuribacter sp.]MBK9617713.1 hypothetical protein [Candidatus Obscuribacter sp.]MBK9774391.1 hypothetical protein [Candidatus Obscuribacter sp.]MDQ5964907.1 hypothetical protein [Cyanobacteriota bacterium erpe_2018_sw_39hr_WHONDRS-SW48-000098_B_bin.30]
MIFLRRKLQINLVLATLLFLTNLPVLAQDQPVESSLPAQIVLPDPTFNNGRSFFNPAMAYSQGQWLRHSLPSTGMSLSAPYIGTVAAPFSVPYSHLPSFVPSIPGIPGIPGISSLNSFVPSYGFGRAFTPYQYMGGRYWGNSYGLNRGGIPSSGRLSSVQVIQTAPSKASGNYYSAPTTDSSASGSYYAGSHNNSYFGNTSIYNSGVYSSRRSLNNSSETNWGASGNPFPKDLNSTPWSSK